MDETTVNDEAAHDAADAKAEAEAVGIAKAEIAKESGKLAAGKVTVAVNADGDLTRTETEKEPEPKAEVEPEVEIETETSKGEDAKEGEKEGEHAEPETTATTTEPSRQLVREAAKLGIPDEDIDSMDAKELAAAVKVAKRFSTAKQQADGGQQQEQKPDFTPFKCSKEQREILGDQAADMLDARAVEEAKRQEAIWKASQKAVQGANERAMAVEQRETTRQLDEYFSKNPELFGEGEAVDLDPSSKEHRNRMKVVRELQNVSPGLAPKKALEAATALAFPKLGEEKARKKIMADVQARRRQAINTPTNREGVSVEKDAESEATEAIYRKAKELALT